MPLPPDVAQIISGSGNTFHAKVARWLRADGWHVVISPYYMDETQNKAREIDLIAERLWPVTNFSRQIGEVAIRLFIECKYVPSPSVFWYTEKNVATAEALVCRTSPFRANNTYTQEHHYLSSSLKVAKLFATGGKAQETDPFYRALNQSLNALVSMRGQPISASLTSKSSSPMAVLNFPVVVCSSFEQIFAVDFYSESDPVPVTDNFQLEVRYAYIGQGGSRHSENFLLDFVEFSQLNKFAAALNQDGKAAAYLAS
jgi:hypothetical protein